MRLRLTSMLMLACLLRGPFTWAAPSLSTPSPASLLQVFDTVLQRVATLRHLAPLRPIKRGIRNRQQIRLLLRDLLDDEFSPHEWAIERQAMYQWGLLPADFPLRTFVHNLLTEQAAGFYDPKQRMFFIADWLPDTLQQPVMAHELVHALQDQHYDLQHHFAPVKGQADLTLAHKALIEGDAVAVMLEYMLQPLGLHLDQFPNSTFPGQSGSIFSEAQFHAYQRAPTVLRQQLLFPYLYGLQFIKAALTHIGWRGLQQVYRQPPESTEQIMHPEKYFSTPPDRPEEVALRLPKQLFQGAWRKIKREVLGEFFLSVILQQFLPEAEAKRSAAGWRGDRCELFEHHTSKRLLLVCVTSWDTTLDAWEFFQSYTQLLGVKYSTWHLLPQTKITEHMWGYGPWRLVLTRRGRGVQIIEGVPAAGLPQLQKLLHSRTIRKVPSE